MPLFRWPSAGLQVSTACPGGLTDELLLGLEASWRGRMTLCEPRGWGYDQGRLHGRTHHLKLASNGPGRRVHGGGRDAELMEARQVASVRWSPPDLSQPSWGRWSCGLFHPVFLVLTRRWN